MQLKQLNRIFPSSSFSTEFTPMKTVLISIAGAIAMNLSLPAYANVNPNGDVEVLSDAEMNAIAAKGNFDYGYCTYYVDQMIRLVWPGFRKGTTWQGNAKDWLKNAAAKGFATSKVPSMYAVSVYGPTAKNAYGHVAFVIGVDSKKGTYSVVEMNYTGFNKVSIRTLANNASGILGFIPRPGK